MSYLHVGHDSTLPSCVLAECGYCARASQDCSPDARFPSRPVSRESRFRKILMFKKRHLLELLEKPSPTTPCSTGQSSEKVNGCKVEVSQRLRHLLRQFGLGPTANAEVMPTEPVLCLDLCPTPEVAAVAVFEGVWLDASSQRLDDDDKERARAYATCMRSHEYTRSRGPVVVARLSYSPRQGFIPC